MAYRIAQIWIVVDDDNEQVGEGFSSQSAASDEARRLNDGAVSQCEECARSHGPHYTGPCDH